MMWFAAFIIMVNGQIVSWKTPNDYFSKGSCMSYMKTVAIGIEYAIIDNSLQGANPASTFGVCIPVKGVSKT